MAVAVKQETFWAISRELVALVRAFGGRATTDQIFAGTLHRDVDETIATAEKLVARGILTEDEESYSLAKAVKPEPEDFKATLRLAVVACGNLERLGADGSDPELALLVRRVDAHLATHLATGRDFEPGLIVQVERRLAHLVDLVVEVVDRAEKELTAEREKEAGQ